VRQADSRADLQKVMALRIARFGVGRDEFDETSAQMMIEQGGQLMATYRLGQYRSGAEMAGSYAAQFYDLSLMEDYNRPALELGRFCLAPKAREADILRLAFAGIAGQVDALGAGLLFGCASFAGVDPAPHAPSLAVLRAHISDHWRILRRGVALDLPPRAQGETALIGARAMPPLLRSYLAMGGWVGDHAVQDHQLGTIHIFTGLEVDRIPPARAAALRGLAAQISDGQS
jgi:putative hemolysin